MKPTTYSKPTSLVEAYPWDGTADGYFAIRDALSARGFVRRFDTSPPRLHFWCSKSEAIVAIGPGGALVAEPDGSGFYPVAPEIVATWTPVEVPS